MLFDKICNVEILFQILIFQSLSWAKTKVTEKPHIVFVLADDLGFNDVGYHQYSGIKTPCIDNLANTGQRLESYYVQPSCSPSRSQLMSARYQIHTGLQHSVILPTQPNGLPLDNIILPQQLGACGYSTNMIGKWHLGFYKPDYLPWKRGFDTFFGILVGGAGYYSHSRTYGGFTGNVMHDSNMGPTSNYSGQYSTELYTEKANAVISGHNSSKPLFLYLAHQTPHGPLEVPNKFLKKYKKFRNDKRKKYAGMVKSLDMSVCSIVKKLKKKNMWKNTIFIFSTDNGGQPKHGGNNWPLRGHKATLWEGGIRGVGFINGGRIKKRNRIVNDLFHISDWMPTLLNASGCPLLNNTPPLDGIDQWGVIAYNEASARTEILHNIDPKRIKRTKKKKITVMNNFDVKIQSALRSGVWKLLTGDPGPGDWIPSPEFENKTTLKSTTTGLYQLYNIASDPYEKHNLASVRTDIVLEMLNKLAAYSEASVPVLFPASDKRANPKRHCGYWAPWLDNNDLPIVCAT